MKTVLKRIAILLFCLVAVCTISLLTDKSRYGQWTVRNDPRSETQLSWAKFYWVESELGSRNYERTAMFIPARIEGLPYSFSFQFDLGSDLTMLYDRNMQSIAEAHGVLSKRIGRLKSPLQFWNSRKAFKNITLDFGELKATSENCFVKANYGEELSKSLPDSTPIPVGTIGADLFQGKVLIIDYPNQRFTICDSLPDAFKVPLTDIALDNAGRALLPLKLRGGTYKALFDNGSSLFPLLVTEDRINTFSTSPPTDTIEISSWGTIHKVIGRPFNDSLRLGEETFANFLVYADYRKEARTNDYDAITGNALFWNRTIIIDFKNKKFGVK